MYSRIKVIDRKSRNVRVWSNRELKKFCKLFTGHICNVSGWKDEDKEGFHYKDYFKNAESYSITNYHDKDARGSQGTVANEIILDLTHDLQNDLIEKFDVVYNHTTLEHIFNCNKAISNLCRISKDIVIVVVPFLQETHGSYGDYWRFTPQGIDQSFKANGLETLYINYNEQGRDSIYLFAIASKKPLQWNSIKQGTGNKIGEIYTTHVGLQIIKNSFIDNISNIVFRILKIKSQ